MRTVALIVAAGRGERLGAALPKQYLVLDGVPVLRRTVLRFLQHPAVDAVRVVIGDGQADLYAEAVAGLDLMAPVTGGASRQASVLCGLESLTDKGCERVLIQDAARPLTSDALIDRVLTALGTSPAALPLVPVTDTLKRLDGERADVTVPRDDLRGAQTPQGFAFDTILAAHRAFADHAMTDDAAVAAAAGVPITAVAGDPDNLKITTAQDLEMVELMLSGRRVTRVGTGFDVHRLVTGRPLILCGVRIPHERGLAGHSDADVAFHAVTDALLGCIADGDIGSHFPPSDERWRDVNSAVFLRHAARLIGERGGRIENVDLTIVCEHPKIGPYRDAMRQRLAEVLGLDARRCGLKATTSEGLGFTGRGEGIAAQAAVSVSLRG